jgi:hypothetical protein
MEVSGQLEGPAALHPGKEPQYPLDRRLGGPQNRSGRGGEEKNSQPLPGLEIPIIQPVTQRCTTELCRLLQVLSLFKEKTFARDDAECSRKGKLRASSLMILLLINKKIKLFTSLFTCFQNQYTRVLMK